MTMAPGAAKLELKVPEMKNNDDPNAFFNELSQSPIFKDDKKKLNTQSDQEKDNGENKLTTEGNIMPPEFQQSKRTNAFYFASELENSDSNKNSGLDKKDTNYNTVPNRRSTFGLHSFDPNIVTSNHEVPDHLGRFHGVKRVVLKQTDGDSGLAYNDEEDFP